LKLNSRNQMYNIRTKSIALLVLLFCAVTGSAQTFDSWFTGNATDMITSPEGGICLMGGASENDEAMKWFLQRCDGGDVLVIRASGSDGYNTYLYTDLGVNVNSVETIRFNSAGASFDPYVLDRIKKAEAIWIAGGDQWDYISYWKDTPVDSLINRGLADRNIVIGGTSAGMAIQGQYYFTAENGTITSATAMSNPYSTNVTVGSDEFIVNSYLTDVITDTHYDNPDRRGRQTTFMARIFQENAHVKGIACDEYTAVCIDENGIARVYGETATDFAYFIQTNCDLSDKSPENCSPSVPLTWDRGGQALKVYKVIGNMSGSNSLDLNDWKTGAGGEWKHWSVVNGTFSETNGTIPDCSIAGVLEEDHPVFTLFPNPVTEGIFQINGISDHDEVELFTVFGESVSIEPIDNDSYSSKGLTKGIYLLIITSEGKKTMMKLQVL
jgi:cyanophycinase-like exopeptidase